jgi:hypothetical protein
MGPQANVRAPECCGNGPRDRGTNGPPTTEAALVENVPAATLDTELREQVGEYLSRSPQFND